MQNALPGVEPGKNKKRKTMNMKITGYTAIEAKENNQAVVLNKYNDPNEDARENISIDDAREIAKEDASLIWAEIEADYLVGKRVEVGEGEDYDTGVVDSVVDGMANVRWDSHVVTRCPIQKLTLTNQ